MLAAVRSCRGLKDDGQSCGAAPLRGGEYCFWHDPGHAEEAAEARRLGGLRRRRETVVAGTYALEGLGTVGDIRRLLEIAVVDVLALENSVARARTLVYLAQTAVRLLEVGELEERVAALEAALGPRLQKVK
ncbi:MAG TPA: hypothetical protein VNM43_05930 [Dehalococcoidia bacterium]|nr:hypothetical protein [Dehalococcoidia bacterium]